MEARTLRRLRRTGPPARKYARRSRTKTPHDPTLQRLMESDESETHNVAADHPEIVQQLTALLDKYIADGRSTPGPEQKNDAKIILRKKPVSPRRSRQNKSRRRLIGGRAYRRTRTCYIPSVDRHRASFCRLNMHGACFARQQRHIVVFVIHRQHAARHFLFRSCKWTIKAIRLP